MLILGDRTRGVLRSRLGDSAHTDPHNPKPQSEPRNARLYNRLFSDKRGFAMLMGGAARCKGFGINDRTRFGVGWAGVCQRARKKWLMSFVMHDVVCGCKTGHGSAAGTLGALDSTLAQDRLC